MAVRGGGIRRGGGVAARGGARVPAGGRRGVLRAAQVGGDVIDCLGRCEVANATGLQADCCVATVASAGFASLLDGMLGSFEANGACEGALLIVFVLDGDEECTAVAARHGAAVVPCRLLTSANPTVKSLLYSVANVVSAKRFLCLDADLIVTGPLQPIFE